MREHRDLIEAYAKHRNGAVLATVVRVRGSAYRRPGARMLLDGNVWLAGAVSGGCLESDVAKKALWRTESGPTLVTYDATLDDDEVTWGFGLGCNGVVDVLMERLTNGPTNPLLAIERCMRERTRAVIATVLDGPELGRRTVMIGDEPLNSTIESGELRVAVGALVRDGGQTRSARANGVEVLVEHIHPPMPLVIFGAGYDVVPLVHAAAAVGFETTVVESVPNPASTKRFAHADRLVQDAEPYLTPDAAVLVMTHNIARDTEIVAKLAKADVRSIGVLGPKSRTDRIIAEVGASNARIHGPVGLDIGAEGADEIAVAIVAELCAVRSGRDGRMLRLRNAPIHT